ncbi:MAG TPA: TonB-dependent receptor, partial [Novosphingobium sp.]|nr:TonB-dependent receptor [Novosphingobium sp.]
MDFKQTGEDRKMSIDVSTRKEIKALLLSCCTILATVAATPAVAQEAEDSGSTVADIIVTAQKREQSLQDVPISVTAVTQETIQANRITDVRDLGSMVPNLAVRNLAGAAGIPGFSMRGLQTVGGLEKSISPYLDGVFIGSSTGSAFELPDLERIEVLRGPQGTLFGRNSTGGAISIVTR